MKIRICVDIAALRNVKHGAHAVLLVVCAGCATYDEPYVSYTGTDGGYLVSSITVVYAQRHGGSYNVYYHAVADPDSRLQIPFLTKNIFGSHEVHFQNDKETSHVVVFRRPPGEYVLSGWHASNSGGYGGWEAEGKLNEQRGFTIEPGDRTYVGEFVFIPYYGTNTFGMEVLGGFEVIVRDNRDRDMEVAERMIVEKESLLHVESKIAGGSASEQ